MTVPEALRECFTTFKDRFVKPLTPFVSHSYFVAYEIIKKKLTPEGSTQLSLPAVMVAGGAAGIAMWSIAIPPDVIKSRLQTAPDGTYSGFIDCIRKTVKADGIGALWKGFSPAMARAVPANAATFLGVEVSIQLMNMVW